MRGGERQEGRERDVETGSLHCHRASEMQAGRERRQRERRALGISTAGPARGSRALQRREEWEGELKLREKKKGDTIRSRLRQEKGEWGEWDSS